MVPARNSQTPQITANLVFAAFQQLIEATERLLRDVANGISNSPHYDSVKELLATVPFSTDEHALASQRLANAWHYADEGENGAARYELIMLVRNFAKRRQMCE